ncbi:hypothetical protein [Desulfogranum marinum]|uniref:hypothetical protein n=1 Tax=Desulfogranum marinum TaxID=453220 RepID=UPI0029C7B7EE|nr:hypothetical protein [Desulfogranum marinum]
MQQHPALHDLPARHTDLQPIGQLVSIWSTAEKSPNIRESTLFEIKSLSPLYYLKIADNNALDR